jgi:hypothetical protein
MSKYLWSDDALKHLQDRGIKRTHSTLHKWAADGTLPATRYEGRRRQYSADALNRFADQHFARGGHDQHMFGQQQAGSRKGSDKSPSTGKPDSRGPGQQFAGGVGAVPVRSAASTAVPAAGGQTGNPRAPTGRRSPTRDYPKSVR